MITYHDTRGLIDEPRTFTEAILEGIAPGGGLFVPEQLPQVTPRGPPAPSRSCRTSSARRGSTRPSASTSTPRAPSPSPPRPTAHNFDDPARRARPRPRATGGFVLELWHGPTLAFKDMALQCMPLFFSEALEQAHAAGRTSLDFLILVATSGDTGVAALNGFADRAHTQDRRVLPGRRRVGGAGAADDHAARRQPHACSAVDGDFDACQTAGQGRLRRRGLRRRSWPSGTAWRCRRPTPSTGAGCCRRSSTT